MIQVFVGWDPREDIAWQVCRHSILARTDPTEVNVVPLVQAELRDIGIYTRPIDLQASTEFSLTRFLTPTLAGRHGYAIFVDCDFLFLSDIRELMADIDKNKAVSVVWHDYIPASMVKMDNRVQHIYPRKNWSSLMVFNLEHPKVRALTPEVVNKRTPSYLHRFCWLDDEDIGEIDATWNHLVGWYPSDTQGIHAIHYTEGGPWFEGRQDCDFAQLWLDEKGRYDQDQRKI